MDPTVAGPSYWTRADALLHAEEPAQIAVRSSRRVGTLRPVSSLTDVCAYGLRGCRASGFVGPVGFNLALRLTGAIIGHHGSDRGQIRVVV